MKAILFLVSVLFLFSFTACDDECVNCTPGSFCNTEELRENVANSVCLAEDYIIGFGCPNVGCFSSDPDINDGDLSTCTVIDCQTLSCEDMRVLFNDPQPGLITEISVDEITGLPIGIFEVDGLEAEFTCLIFVP
ncbi:MAG: hypothetical protein WD000_05310 [Thermodesulfobacteriota bacterium]